MRLALLMAIVLALTGCAAQPQADSEVSSRTIESAVSVDEGPVDDPSLAREDADGHTPDDAVLALVDALNRHDWEMAYDLYAQPYVDYEEALRSWTEDPVGYSDFTVLEVRVEREDLAFVLVECTAQPGGEVAPAWWAVDKVDGLWKTRWMPVQ